MLTIGEKIKKIRILNNLTQYELAEMLFVSEKTISSWENIRCIPIKGYIWLAQSNVSFFYFMKFPSSIYIITQIYKFYKFLFIGTLMKK